MSLCKAMNFVERSRVELTGVGMSFLLAGAAAGYAPAAEAGWAILTLLAPAMIWPRARSLGGRTA